MKFYLALKFSPQSLAWPQLESFSRRVETHQRANRFEMAILPPFGHETLLPHELSPIWEDLCDTIEGHLLGLDELQLMKFHNLKWRGGSKSSFLGLGPEFSEDWFHCQEEVKEELLAQGFQFKKAKNRRKNPEVDLEVELPLAGFQDSHELPFALEQAQLELQLPLTLRTDFLGLFEKGPLGVKLLRKVFTFSATEANLELERYSFTG